MAELTHEISQEEAAAKAAVLIESLPWLKRFRGETIVVKFGGNAMVDESLKRAFAEDIVYLLLAGIHPVVVHGGGPQISAELARQGIASEFVGGHRVTTPEAIGVVRDVLANQVGAELVALINEHGDFATSVPGDTHGLLVGQRRGAIVDGATVDLGRVGEVTAVDPRVLLDAIEAGRVPVISTLAIESGTGQVLNVNADSAAASIAVALGAAKLVVLTDVAGLYRDWPDRDSLVSVITTAELTELLPSLESGMIPKMTACLDAVAGGVAKAAIIDGRIQHSILLEVFTQGGIGTEVVAQ
ncbi:MAG: acetylglutamate kinase [Rhodoglobus sp.]